MKAFFSFLRVSILVVISTLSLSIGSAQHFDHQLFDVILQEYVDSNGFLDYKGLSKDRRAFDEYIELLSTNHPEGDIWSREEQLAYWINAYNAFTIQLVLDHYPIQSIKDIKRGIPFVNTVWDIKFIHIEGHEYDLNNIEHGIIRKKFGDPRIHFALNCASYSCPRLTNRAYVAERLDEQLTAAAFDFFRDERKNKISPASLKLNSIMKWYKMDFTKGQSLIDFINRYTAIKIDPYAKVEYLDYNWSLNASSF